MSAGLGDKGEALRLLLGRQAEPRSIAVIKVSFLNRGWKRRRALVQPQEAGRSDLH